MEELITFGIVLILIGALLTFLGFVFQVLSQPQVEKKVEGGGIVMIGPIPILLATDRNLAVVLALLMLGLMLLAFFLLRSAR